MEISYFLSTLQSAAVLLISNVLLITFMYGARYFKGKNRQNIKRYTFEFCRDDTKNYSDIFSKTQLKYQSKNSLTIYEPLEQQDYNLDLLDTLMHFEKISIAVKNEIFDEEIIKDYYSSYFTLFYKLSKYKILLSYRSESSNPYAFIEFEKLSNKWSKTKKNGVANV